MNTTNKLAEALTLGLECAYELLAEKRQALAGHPEKVAPYQEMADYLRTFPERFTIPQPALAQRREPLTASQVNELCNECHLDWHRGWSLDEEPNRYLELASAIEKHHGIGATTGQEPGNG